MVLKSLGLTIIALFIVGLIVLAMTPDYSRVREGHADAGYLDSAKCISCHTDHHRSWARTFHSRMTQDARPETVQGDFENDNVFEYLGIKARMEKRGATFTMSLTFPDGRTESHTIERTVGSRRIEQYVTRQNDQHIRLPLAYDLVNRRWMSLNGSFFHPDSDNYFQHRAQWDANCVFCHNVKAQPNFNPRSGQFKTEVAELGIACGACHGQSAAHAEEAASPLVRTLWRTGTSAEKSIINPSKLTPERSLMVCGHCHGQRVPQPLDRIQEILGRGDPYNAGEDLSAFYTPVSHETVLQSKNGPYSFANRFWANGSPRLTAYEYQGVLRSACFTKGERERRINCLTCHSMHEGDIRGQIREENRTNKPCLECHQQYETPAALTKHTGHILDSPASNCYTCHMPRVVYGIMSVHRTHDITIPDPQLTISQSVPNACNQCHLEKSVNWSIAAVKRLWPDRFASAQPSADEQFNLPEGPRALFAGDALIRALAAEALGGGEGMNPDKEWARPFLIEAFADNYPIVRFFAANSLARNYERIPKPDYLATAEARQRMLAQWREVTAPDLLKQTTVFAEMLRRRRKDVDIEVGE